MQESKEPQNKFEVVKEYLHLHPHSLEEPPSRNRDVEHPKERKKTLSHAIMEITARA